MKTRNCTLLILMVLILATSTPSRACMCQEWHLQSHFCNTPIVIRGEFVSVPEQNHRKRYSIKPKEVYRGGDWPQDVIAVTTLFGTSCEYKPESINFNIDNLIMGSKQGGDLYVDSCSFIKPWSELSPRQILGIQGAYTTSCNCKLISCRYSEPCAPTVNECVFQRHRGNFHNQDQNQTCFRNEAGICQWQTIVDHLDAHDSPARTNNETNSSFKPLR